MKVCLFGELASNKTVKLKIKTGFEIIESGDILNDNDKFGNLVISDDIIYITNSNECAQLIKAGVATDKILDYTIFGNLTFFNPIAGLTNKYDTLMLGMSHSECGVNEKLLDGGYCFKESSPSIDMFLHLRFLELLRNTQPNVLKGIKNYIFEMPYYIFNYDLSRFGNFTLSKLNYFDIVSDYHHLTERTNFTEVLDKYRLYKELFTEGIMSPVESQMNNEHWLKKAYHGLRNGLEILRNHDKVWCEVYTDTIKENKGYWNAILNLIKESSPKAKLQVLIMPLNPLFKVSKRRDIQKQRSIFYDNICLEKESIIDDFERNLPYSWYDDHCHISKKRTNDYTLLLNERLRTCNP